MSDPENTRAIQDTRWKPGQSGNPAGKPKGARHKIQEDFLRDVQKAWEAKGTSAIDGMIEQKPHEFVKMVAGLMPKEATFTFNTMAELTDDELAERIRNLAAQLAPFLIDGNGTAEAGDSGPTVKSLPARVH